MWNTKEMSQLDAALTVVPLALTIDLGFLRSNCISGMGGPIVMERKGQEWIGCDTLRKWVNWTQRWLGYFWSSLWPWIFKVEWYLGNGRPDCHETKGTGVDRMPWYETQPLCDFEVDGYCYGPGWLKMSALLSTRLVIGVTLYIYTWGATVWVYRLEIAHNLSMLCSNLGMWRCVLLKIVLLIIVSWAVSTGDLSTWNQVPAEL